MLTLTLTLTLTCQHRSCARTATMRPAGRSLSTRCTHWRAAVAEAGSKWQVPQRKTSTAPQRTLASRLGVGSTFAAVARRTCDEKHARCGAGKRGPSGRLGKPERRALALRGASGDPAGRSVCQLGFGMARHRARHASRQESEHRQPRGRVLRRRQRGGGGAREAGRCAGARQSGTQHAEAQASTRDRDGPPIAESTRRVGEVYLQSIQPPPIIKRE